MDTWTGLRAMASLVRTPRVAGAVLAIAAAGVAAHAAGLEMLAGSVLSGPAIAAAALYEVGTWLAVCVAGAAVGWLLPVRTAPTLRHAAVVAAFALAASVARALLQLALTRTIGATPIPLDVILARLLPAYFLTACTCAGLGVGLRSLMRERELAAAAARMEAELARARMRTVFGAIHPQRVLATLDAIARGMEIDARAADRLLVSLGELLRLSLQRARADDVTLADELRYVSALLEVEARRAGQPIARFRQDVAEPLLEARMPPGSLSTLAEAALEAAAAAGVVLSLELAAETVDGRLRLSLADDAPLSVAARARTPHASAHADDSRFAASHALRCEDRRGGGAVAHLELPLRLDGVEAAR
jgi:hypothetical protein